MTISTTPKTDEEHVKEIREAVNRLQNAMKSAIRHGLLIDIEIEGDEDDDTIPVLQVDIFREWKA